MTSSSKSSTGSSPSRSRRHSDLDGIDKIFMTKEQESGVSMAIGGVTLFNKTVEIGKIICEFEKLVAVSPRLTQVLHSGGAYWEECENYDISKHITVVNLDPTEVAGDGDGGDTALKRFAAKQLSTPLPSNRPLWHADVVYGLSGARSAVIFRIHHAITDGQGAVHMVLSMMQSADGSRPLQANAKRSDSPVRAQEVVKRSAVETLQRSLQTMSLMLLKLYLLLAGMFNQLYILFAYRKIAFQPDVADVGPYVTDWSTGVQLSDIKTIKTAFRCTVNDVLLTLVAQSTRRYLTEQKMVAESDLLVFMPVSFREIGDYKLANRSMISPLWLPIDQESSEKALRIVAKRTSVVKTSPETRVSYHASRTMLPLIPAPMFLPLTNHWMAKASVLLTNVPGPMDQLNLADCVVERFLPLVPMLGTGSVVIGVVSYAGTVVLTATTCERRLNTVPSRLVALFEEEFLTMLQNAKANEGKKQK